MEQRREAVLKLLDKRPEITRAWVADGDADPVVIHLGIRGVGTCELTIQADRFDSFEFLTLMEAQYEKTE